MYILGRSTDKYVNNIKRHVITINSSILQLPSGCAVRIIGITLNCFFSLGSYLTEYKMSQTYKPFLRPQRQPHSEMTLRMIIRTPLEGSSQSRQYVSAENRPFKTFSNGGCNLKLALFRAGRQVTAL